MTVPYASAYCATKHALEAIAEGLKTELEPFNIKIATVNPGAFDTGFNDRGMDSIRPVSYTHLDVYKRQTDPAGTI